MTEPYRKASFVSPIAGIYTWWIAILVLGVVIRRQVGDVRQPYVPGAA